MGQNRRPSSSMSMSTVWGSTLSLTTLMQHPTWIICRLLYSAPLVAPSSPAVIHVCRQHSQEHLVSFWRGARTHLPTCCKCPPLPPTLLHIYAWVVPLVQETHAWLAFAMCTAAGHQPFKARQRWVEPEPWDAVQSVVRTEVCDFRAYQCP
jgi:hypothetical protein